MPAGRKPQGPSVASERVTIRVPLDVVKRADALVMDLDVLSQQKGFGVVTRSVVFRHALLRGLEVLEAEH